MRVTQSMIAGDFLYSVNKNREKIVNLQSDLASGKRVRTVSDDPTASEVILRLNAALDKNDQYQSSVGDAQGMVSAAASSLDAMNNLMQEAQTILVQATNGQQTSSMTALADRLDQLLQEAVATGNTQFNGKYLFGGTLTTTAPYQLNANPAPPPSQTVTFSGNAQTIQYATGEGVMQQVSISGAQAFGGTALFDALIQARDSLRNGVTPTAAMKTAVGNALTTVTASSGLLGSLSQSLDNMTIHLMDQKTQLQKLLSAEQDTDVAQATVDLKQAETMLDAALNTGAQILPKSILDFLK